MKKLVTEKLGVLKKWLLDRHIEDYTRYMTVLSGVSSTFGFIETPFVQSFVNHWKNNRISNEFIQHVQKFDLINKHIIFASINTDDSANFDRENVRGKHWILCAIVPTLKKVYLIDSLKKNDYPKLVEYCLAMALTITRVYYSKERMLWTVYIAEDFLEQKNDYDCNVHVCMNAVDIMTRNFRTTWNLLKYRSDISKILGKKLNRKITINEGLFTPTFNDVKCCMKEINFC